MPSIGFNPGRTIRETVASALDNIGRDWTDVIGIHLDMGEEGTSSEDDLWDWATGEVRPEKLDAVLDLETETGTKWGGSSYGYNSFNLVLWLDDCTVRFSERYDKGDYTECFVTPNNPPAAYEYDGRSAPQPR
jgi:hypothetical protein